jgi:hypothetical protein
MAEGGIVTRVGELPTTRPYAAGSKMRASRRVQSLRRLRSSRFARHRSTLLPSCQRARGSGEPVRSGFFPVANFLLDVVGQIQTGEEALGPIDAQFVSQLLQADDSQRDVTGGVDDIPRVLISREDASTGSRGGTVDSK